MMDICHAIFKAQDLLYGLPCLEKFEAKISQEVSALLLLSLKICPKQECQQIAGTMMYCLTEENSFGSKQ